MVIYQMSKLIKVFKFCIRYPLVGISSFILLILLLVSLFAPFIWTIDPTQIFPAQRLRPPSLEHWFGTDALGRDIYSRVVYGARTSLFIGFAVTAISYIIGITIGFVSAFNRFADAILMRVIDGVMSIPSVLLAIALTALAEPGMMIVIFAISIIEIPRVTRLVRGMTLSLKEELFIEAAYASGTSTSTTLFRHILPNISAPMFIQASQICAQAMLIEATLSFIGAGVPPNNPTWGNVIAEGRSLYQIAPHMILFAALALAITVLAMNLLADGLRDALDPKLNKAG